jgi:DNA polymerase III epsilon subunit-like protein
MFLIVDTETNGLGTGGGVSSSSVRGTTPRLLELAFLLVDGDGRVDRSYSHLILPEGFRVPKESSAVHGITAEMAVQEGVPARNALLSFLDAAGRAKVIVAHNARFDLGVIAGEVERHGLSPTPLARPWYCTMRGGVHLCRERRSPGPSWPTLDKLHMTLFGEGFPGGHRALADAEACARCFFEMRRRRQLNRSGLIWNASQRAIPLRRAGRGGR